MGDVLLKQYYMMCNSDK